MAGDAGTELSKGGMRTKVEAGKIAMAAGTHMVITTGKVLNPLKAISDGCPCTWFIAPSDPVTARKRWLAGQLEPKGTVEIDAGAEKALTTGKSLLPAGVRRVEGTFERGDAVVIRGPEGREVGRGLVAYSVGDAGASSASARRDRGDPRLLRPRRTDPSRRHGAEQELTKSPFPLNGRREEATRHAQ